MKPFFEETITSHRAILTKDEDVVTNKENAEAVITGWYDQELPMDQLIQKAQELNKNVITIETKTITQRSYVVDE